MRKGRTQMNNSYLKCQWSHQSSFREANLTWEQTQSKSPLRCVLLTVRSVSSPLEGRVELSARVSHKEHHCQISSSLQLPQRWVRSQDRRALPRRPGRNWNLRPPSGLEKKAGLKNGRTLQFLRYLENERSRRISVGHPNHSVKPASLRISVEKISSVLKNFPL